MNTMTRLYLLGLILSASLSHAQSSASRGEAVTIETADKVEIVLKGEAAETLYSSLLNNPAANELPCRGGSSVRLAPVLCVSQHYSGTQCYLNLDKEAWEFVTSKVCEELDPSIIGVGNFKKRLEK